MRRRLLLAAALLLAVLLPAAPASAITNGTADGNGHPNVGGLVSPTQYSDGTWIYCSGTLISPTVFLTAAHCGEGDRVRVTFDPDYRPATRSTPAPSTPTRSTRAHERPARHRRRRARQGGQGHHARPGCPAADSLSGLSVDAAVHVGRLRRVRGDERARAATSTSTTTCGWSRPAR